MYAALGLGFLTKGPIILMVAAVAIIPYLAVSGRLVPGLRRLADGWGLLLLTVMAAMWPVAVLREDPDALRLWLMEISEKTGVLQILRHRRHSLLAVQWPGMMLPWSLIALAAVVLPFLPEFRPGDDADRATHGRRSRRSSPVWFAWWWAIGNLGVFCLWAIAKPNYYLPCLPGMALLIGSAWVRLARRARARGKVAAAARAVLQAQWVLIFVGAVVAPLVARPWLPPALWPWSLGLAAALAIAVVVSAHAWRRGADVLSLAPVAAACVLGIVIVYGVLAPAGNARRSHRELAQTLQRLVPRNVQAIHFFNPIDEGLWFYLAGRDFIPVPGSQPRYNTAYELVDAYRDRRLPSESIEVLDARRLAHDRQVLMQWLDHDAPGTRYLLMRSSLYDQFAHDVSGRATPLFREAGLARNELVLLQVDDRRPLAARATAPIRR
jgi:4-amino-4-deoxy-L-arabinose transferase-like glycosyltransferase